MLSFHSNAQKSFGVDKYRGYEGATLLLLLYLLSSFRSLKKLVQTYGAESENIKEAITTTGFETTQETSACGLADPICSAS